jgi:hypothetical protein
MVACPRCGAGAALKMTVYAINVYKCIVCAAWCSQAVAA